MTPLSRYLLAGSLSLGLLYSPFAGATDVSLSDRKMVNDVFERFRAERKQSAKPHVPPPGVREQSKRGLALIESCVPTSAPSRSAPPTNSLAIAIHERQDFSAAAMHSDSGRLVLDLDTGMLVGAYVEAAIVTPHYSVSRTKSLTCVKWADTTTGKKLAQTTNVVQLTRSELVEARERVRDLRARTQGQPGAAKFETPRCGPDDDRYSSAIQEILGKPEIHPSPAEALLWAGAPLQQTVIPRTPSQPIARTIVDWDMSWRAHTSVESASSALRMTTPYRNAQHELGLWLSTLDQSKDTSCQAIATQSRASLLRYENSLRESEKESKMAFARFETQASVLRRACAPVPGTKAYTALQLAQIKNGFVIEYVDSFHQEDTYSATAVDFDRETVIHVRRPQPSSVPRAWFPLAPEVQVSC